MAPRETPNESAAPPKRRLVERTLSAVWLLNFLLLAAAAAWLIVDPYAPRVVVRLASISAPWKDVGEFLDFPHERARVVFVAAAIAIVSLLGVIIALFLGPPRHRRLRSWLALTTLVALWLALFASWREFAWAGARWRLGQQLNHFEPVAAALRDNWPQRDGDIPGLGYFTAYPSAEATTLLVISDDTPPGRAPIAAVEHSPAGALRFQLAGDETGAWLEWRPPDSEPASFKGGLDTKYILDRTSPLGDGWFLSHYH
jgi:hypothetical protein